MPAPIFDLNQYDLNSLRELADLYRLAPGRQLKKGELVTTLSRQFQRPEFIAQAVAALNPLERRVLELLQMAPIEGLTVPALFRLAETTGIAPLPTEADLASQGASLRRLDIASASLPKTPLRLCALGLAVAWLGQSASRMSNQPTVSLSELSAIGLPEHVRNVLPPVIWAPKLLAETEIKDFVSGSARSFQRNRFFYWGQVRRQPVTIKQDGFLYKRDLKLIDAALIQPTANLNGEPEHPELLFLRLMAHSLALLNMVGEGTIIAADAPAFFDDKPENRIRACFESWQRARWWRETSYHVYANDDATITAHLRQILIANLRQAPVDRWIDRSSLAGVLAPALMGAIYNATSLYSFYGHNVLREIIVFASRLIAPAETLSSYLATSLEGPLHWMGLVDVGFDARKKPIAFRLTSAGALALGLIAQLDLPAVAGQVIVQPNFHILAIDPVPDTILAALDSFASRQKAGRVTEFEITKASVHHGALNGWPVRRVIDFLQQSSAAALPGNVLRSLQEWEEGHDRIRFLFPVAVLETASPAETAALHRQPATAAVLGRMLTPTLSLVNDLNALEAAMSGAGLLLEQSSAQASAAWPAFRLGDDGLLRPTTPVLGLSVSAQVAAFTENTDAGLLLSPRAVGTAVKAGLKVEAIIAALNKALVHPLSPAWERRLKTWTSHFGSARTTSRAFLALQSAEVLAELCNDPQIARLLKPFHTKHVLASFDPADRQRLQELLANYGVDLSDDLL